AVAGGERGGGAALHRALPRDGRGEVPRGGSGGAALPALAGGGGRAPRAGRGAAGGARVVRGAAPLHGRRPPPRRAHARAVPGGAEGAAGGEAHRAVGPGG